MRTTLLSSSLLSTLLEGLSMELRTSRSSRIESSERGLGLGLLGTWRERGLRLQLNRTHNSNLLTQVGCQS